MGTAFRARNPLHHQHEMRSDATIRQRTNAAGSPELSTTLQDGIVDELDPVTAFLFGDGKDGEFPFLLQWIIVIVVGSAVYMIGHFLDGFLVVGHANGNMGLITFAFQFVGFFVATYCSSMGRFPKSTSKKKPRTDEVQRDEDQKLRQIYGVLALVVLGCCAVTPAVYHFLEDHFHWLGHGAYGCGFFACFLTSWVPPKAYNHLC